MSTTELKGYILGEGPLTVPRGTSTEKGARAEIKDQDDRLQLSQE